MNTLPATSHLQGKRESSRLLPYLALGVGVLGLGFSAIFVRWAEAPGPVTGLYRLAIAIAILAVPFLNRVRRQGTPTRRALALATLGGLFFALDLAFWNTSVHFTTAANATLLTNTSPLWVGLGAALFFKEKFGGRFWLGLSVIFAGAVLILGTDALRHPRIGWGDLLALISGLFYGMYFLVTQRGRERLDSLTYFWLAAASGTLALLLLNLGLGHRLTGYSPITYLAFLALGVLTQVVGYLAINYALGHLPASLVAPTLLGQPVLTALLAVPLLGEAIGAYQWVGGAIVLFGIALVHHAKREAAPRGPART